MVLKLCAICEDEFEARGSGKTCGAACRTERKRNTRRKYRAKPETKERRRERRSWPANKERARKQQVEYRAQPEIKEHTRKSMSEYNARPENKERERERKVEYYSHPKNKEQLRIRSSNRRARENGLPGNFPQGTQYQDTLNYFGGCCAVCDCQLNGVHLDHWIPLDYKGEDNPGTVVINMLPLCQYCNLSKHATLPDVWLRRKFSEDKAQDIEQKVAAYFDSVKGNDYVARIPTVI